MPVERRLRNRRLRNSGSHFGPVTWLNIQRQSTPDPLPPPLDVFVTRVASTPVHAATRQVGTEPSTPTSPTLHTKAYRRALQRQRQRNAHLVQAVLHYDRTENDLQLWYW
jgi:hypothetical protein